MKKLLLLSLILLIATMLQAQVYKTVNLISPGTLSTALTAYEQSSITNLTVTGTIDAGDFYAMYNMPMLSVINLSAANIAAYGDGSTYPSNTVPTYAFCNPYTYSGSSTLDSIILPATATVIGHGAFGNCTSLASVTFPSALDSIGSDVFYGCSNLASVALPPTTTSVGDGAFWYCSSLSSVSMPAVTNISDYAFDNCTSLTAINLPVSLTTIGKNVFNSSGLKAITIPAATTAIGDSTFMKCSELQSVTFATPASLTTISNDLFYACASLDTISVPTSVTSIGMGAFLGSGLTGIYLPPSLLSIGAGAFYSCFSLSTINIPASDTSIGSGAFRNCSGLKGALTIPASVKSIGAFGFYGCINMASVAISASVTSIGNATFAGDAAYITVDPQNADYSSLDGVLYNKTQTTLIQCPTSKTGSFFIPSTVTTVGFGSFGYCSKLTSMSIPASVTTIESNAFYVCGGLQSITDYSPIPVPVDSSVFVNDDTYACTLYVPVGSKSAYEAAPYWQYFGHIIEGSGFWISDSTVSLANNANSSSIVYVGSNLTWTITNSNPSWLTVSPNTATTGNDSLLFTATANTTGSARSAIVTVSGNGVTDTITVTQFTTLLSAKSIVYLAKDSGSQATAYITSNTSWKATANQSWINLDPDTTTTGSMYLYVSGTKNPTNSMRTATVTLSATGVTPQTIMVYQAGDSTTIAVSTSSITENGAANSDSIVKVTANTSWTASSDQSWLTLSPTTTTVGNGTLTLTVLANTTINPRLATITISAIGMPAQIITVMQEGTTAIGIVNANGFRLYPNPATSYFSVNSEGAVTIDVYTLNGTLLLNKLVGADEKISTKSLPAGLYIVKIKTGETVVTNSLIVK